MDESICRCCEARGGFSSDRCTWCAGYSGLQCGGLSMADLEGLDARGKLAYLLVKIANQGTRNERAQGDRDNAP